MKDGQSFDIETGEILLSEIFTEIDIGYINRTSEKPEYIMQSNFINMLVNKTADKALFEESIGSGNLVFIASEFVIHKGNTHKKDIMDVLAYSGNTLYAFELKAGPPYNGEDGLAESIKRYKNKYGVGGTRFNEMCKILGSYPNNVASEINDVKFFAVIINDVDEVNDMSKLKSEQF